MDDLKETTASCPDQASVLRAVDEDAANERGAGLAGALFGQFHPGLTVRTRHDNSQRMVRAHDRLTNQSRGLSRCHTA